jgi:hypothetical protein
LSAKSWGHSFRFSGLPPAQSPHHKFREEFEQIFHTDPRFPSGTKNGFRARDIAYVRGVEADRAEDELSSPTELTIFLCPAYLRLTILRTGERPYNSVFFEVKKEILAD